MQGRTMYAEDKRLFPDTTSPVLSDIDRLWLSYSDQQMMGDMTKWGPRPRLRCGGRIVPPGEAVTCLTKARLRSLLGPRARLFVAVDAPRLQQAVGSLAGVPLFVTPGVGVDPTNEFRDATSAQGQIMGQQDLAEVNLIKVLAFSAGG
ncbi:MAG: hypothetical protein SGPRY_014811 [Prymnesium sp.]